MLNKNLGKIDVGKLEKAISPAVDPEFGLLRNIFAQEIDPGEVEEANQQPSPEEEGPNPVIDKIAAEFFNGNKDVARGYWGLYESGWMQKAEDYIGVITQLNDELQSVFQGGDVLQVTNNTGNVIDGLNILLQTLVRIDQYASDFAEEAESEMISMQDSIDQMEGGLYQ